MSILKNISMVLFSPNQFFFEITSHLSSHLLETVVTDAYGKENSAVGFLTLNENSLKTFLEAVSRGFCGEEEVLWTGVG